MSQSPPDILTTILQRKREEVAERCAKVSLDEMRARAQQADKVRGFFNALESRAANQQYAVIAEIKKASPSKGVLRENFDPVAIAKSISFAATMSAICSEVPWCRLRLTSG